MQIVCPNCTTSYQIADTAVGNNGRSVRCVRCQTVWHAAPPAAAAPGVDETVAAFRAELGARAPAPSGPEPAAPSTAPGDAPGGPSLDDLISASISEEAGAAAAPDQPTALALADIPIPVEDPPPLVPAPPVIDVTSLDDNGPPDIESVAARRAR